MRSTFLYDFAGITMDISMRLNLIKQEVLLTTFFQFHKKIGEKRKDMMFDVQSHYLVQGQKVLRFNSTQFILGMCVCVCI